MGESSNGGVTVQSARVHDHAHSARPRSLDSAAQRLCVPHAWRSSRSSALWAGKPFISPARSRAGADATKSTWTAGISIARRRLGGLLEGVPVLAEIELMGESPIASSRSSNVCGPHILHAHSPVLNAIPALRVGRRLGIPVVYEVRALWEDAAVDHGTAREGGLRYRAHAGASRRWALKRADAVTTICEGLRGDIVARGIPAEKVTVIPNAVDIDEFYRGRRARCSSCSAQLGLDGALVLGFVGSFYAYEGLHLLLRALPAILARSAKRRACCWSAAAARKRRSRRLSGDSASRTGRVRRTRAARRGAALLRSDRRAGLPASVDAPDRTGHAFEAAGSDGAGPPARRLRRRRAPRADTRRRDGHAVQGRRPGGARRDGARIAASRHRWPSCAQGGRGTSSRTSATGRTSSRATAACTRHWSGRARFECQGT